MCAWWVDQMVDHLNVSYLYKKRGVFYFSKRVSCDVKSYYRSDRIVICLKTKSNVLAIRASKSLYQKLDRVEASIIDTDDKNVVFMWGKIKRRYVKNDTFVWTNEKAANEAHCSKSNVKTIMRKLEKVGAIKCIQKGKSGSFTKRANHYRREV
jgi:hypothetical protein